MAHPEHVRLNPFDKKIKKILPEYFADNIWITISGNFSDHALINAILTVGADRILFSVDYPYTDNAKDAGWIERMPISELVHWIPASATAWVSVPDLDRSGT